MPIPLAPNYQLLLKQFPALEQHKPLASLVTFNIGGPADLFYKLTDTSELEPLLKTAKELDIATFILGGGSNTIFADEGFRGLVIHMVAKTITTGPGESVVAESGALLSQVIQFALKNNLSGMEKMMGLPGTIGGAVRGNAGAFGIEIKDIFQKAQIYNQEKGLYEASAKDLHFDYRTSKIKASAVAAASGSATPEIVLKVWLKLHEASPEQAKAALAEAMDIVKNRISKQPKGKCSGSFFKNPVTPDYKNPAAQPKETKAGYLLEQIGAKGLQVGGVKVSDQHANWLMNTGNGTQKEVRELSKLLQNKVKERFNIALEREVQLVSVNGQLIS